MTHCDFPVSSTLSNALLSCKISSLRPWNLAEFKDDNLVAISGFGSMFLFGPRGFSVPRISPLALVLAWVLSDGL
eukprot:CAMPEP_0194058134 /NCGR_PEP_ID=MMETSP0009_2-20130614/65285_1 /TAXON_ID=210454 /ORGANISM="Grammatophora oceanica, Strain CCMP 410" /LENGTH=74 /DNA_ID=CAMNT_0038708139 /DNA_START=101 /DNA_END=322 /DNA_ORIENTATION=+